jgi:hypothetical protein
MEMKKTRSKIKVVKKAERWERFCITSGNGSGIVVMATTAPCDVNVNLRFV